jgi:hypothetical protein
LQRVRDLARKRVYHINKEGFLPAFKHAFFDVFTYNNYKKAFKASRLVPINAQVIINRLNVRLRTPPLAPLLETLWQLKTLNNTYEFRLQLKLVGQSFVRLPITA